LHDTNNKNKIIRYKKKEKNKWKLKPRIGKAKNKKIINFPSLPPNIFKQNSEKEKINANKTIKDLQIAKIIRLA
jgi:hypothetical protein